MKFKISALYSILVLSLTTFLPILIQSSSHAAVSDLNPITWGTLGNLSSARQGMGTATVNGKIYIFGGNQRYSGDILPSLDMVEEYEPLVDEWLQRSAMPTARWLPGATAAKGKIYVVGGWTHGNWTVPSGRTEVVEEYNPATDQWTVKQSMPTSRGYLGAATGCNGRIYAIGGWDGSSPLNTVEEYDPATDQWTVKQSMPTPRWNLAVVTGLNCKIYAVGGQGTSGYYNTVEEYDPATDQWTVKQSMPSSRGYLGLATASSGRIYAVGGWRGSSSGYLSNVDEYDPLTDQWTTKQGLPTGRAAPGVAAIGNSIYVIGGEVWYLTSTDIVEEGVLGFPFLDLPINYPFHSSIALLNWHQGGNVNTWFDHEYPTYKDPPNFVNGEFAGGLHLYNGNRLTTKQGEIVGKPCYGTSMDTRFCYDGHDGIDFIKRELPNIDIVAAAAGKVVWRERTSYGESVVLDHQNGYYTLYGHLAEYFVSVNDKVGSGDMIGVMGTTGSSSTGIHLHFGIYLDNGNGIWGGRDEEIPVNPNGYEGDSDPWATESDGGISNYLWLFPLGIIQDVSSNEATTISHPSGILSVEIPSGALVNDTTVDLSFELPVANSSSTLRSAGPSFRIVDSSSSSSQQSTLLNIVKTNEVTLTQPINISVNYTDTQIVHLDEGQIAIYHWDEVGGEWDALLTTIDIAENTASAQALELGHFNILAPIYCPSEFYVNDDTFYGAIEMELGVNETRIFDIYGDEDWFMLMSLDPGVYTIETNNLDIGVNTLMELYGHDGVTLVDSDDNGGEGNVSRIILPIAVKDTYYIRIYPADSSAFGCDAGYDLIVNRSNWENFLPYIQTP